MAPQRFSAVQAFSGTLICLCAAAAFTAAACANNCENGGTCVADKCECDSTKNFTGPDCNTEKDKACDHNPCSNNGTCTLDSQFPFYKCNCTGTGYSGSTCEDDACTPNPCLSKGTCELQSTGSLKYKCHCLTGYSGNNCERAPTSGPCKPDAETCKNGGVCEEQSGSPGFKCHCETGFSGNTCSDKDSGSLGMHEHGMWTLLGLLAFSFFLRTTRLAL